MKKRFLSLIFAVMFLVIFLSSFVQSQAYDVYYDSMSIAWTLKPEFEREDIHYCSGCLTRPEPNEDMNDLELIIKYMTEGNGFIGVEHGYTMQDYFYDAENEIFVVYTQIIGGDPTVEYCKIDELEEYLNLQFTNQKLIKYENHLIPVGRIDLNQFKFDGESWDFDYTYTGDKYALMYDDKFVTDFIYDDAKSIRNYQNAPKDIIDMKINDKWGIINKDGNILVPCLFDDIEFIDDDFAFAKYDGKYGIIDVEKTALALSSPVQSPETGESDFLPIFIFIQFIAVCSIYIVHRQRKKSSK